MDVVADRIGRAADKRLVWMRSVYCFSSATNCLSDLQREGFHADGILDVGHDRNGQTTFRKEVERRGASDRAGPMANDTHLRAGQRDGVDLPAQRESGGGAGREPEWRQEERDGFGLQESRASASPTRGARGPTAWRGTRPHPK